MDYLQWCYLVSKYLGRIFRYFCFNFWFDSFVVRKHSLYYLNPFKSFELCFVAWVIVLSWSMFHMSWVRMSSLMFILLFLPTWMAGYWNLQLGVWICPLGLMSLKDDYPVLPGVQDWGLLFCTFHPVFSCLQAGCVCTDLVCYSISAIFWTPFSLAHVWVSLFQKHSLDDLLLFRTKFL